MVQRLRTGKVVSNAPDGGVATENQNRQFLDPQEGSDYLRRIWNLSRGPRRVGELRAEGTGPLFFRAGNEVRYTPEHLDDYARKVLGEPVSSTAEESARRWSAPEPMPQRSKEMPRPGRRPGDG